MLHGAVAHEFEVGSRRMNECRDSRERERVKRDSPESETAESSQSAAPAFSSQELLTSKQHTRKLVGVGERIIGQEQALELIKLTAAYPP